MGNPGRSGHRMATGAEAMLIECRNAVSKFFGLNDPARPPAVNLIACVIGVCVTCESVIGV